ncbi:MAG: ABC transporter permease [Bacteroidetes bacterium]|nr:ABC transporter permease [Bacteroidota bacterium]MDA1120580.1 ABC transporter permease [Bacteroidota bacterium]
MFDYQLLKGNRSTLLTEPNSIVLTKSMVEKYLHGLSDPIGQLLKVDGGWHPGTYKITCVQAYLKILSFLLASCCLFMIC